MRGVDFEITGIDIVTLHYHLEYFWLVNCSFFHKVDDFVLDSDRMIHIVIKLNL